MRIVSSRRSLKLKGHSFREFLNRVIPLLDGQHSMEEIARQSADLFREEDLHESLELLNRQGVLVEGEHALPGEVASRLAPQINLFHDLVGNGWAVQSRLQEATVAVLGLGGAGAGTALTLAMAGVGKIRCIDSSPVSQTDVYLSSTFSLADVGALRAEALARKIGGSAPQVRVACHTAPIDSEPSLREAVGDARFVVCCLDASQVNLAFKLNRLCLTQRIPWITCTLNGAEVIVGPAMQPDEGPCYMCYRMRAVACAGNPTEAFAFERYLDRRRLDESNRRENLVFGAGLAANALSAETVKLLAGLAEPSLAGRILTIQLMDLSMERHAVLRKPWCPACFNQGEVSNAG